MVKRESARRQCGRLHGNMRAGSVETRRGISSGNVERNVLGEAVRIDAVNIEQHVRGSGEEWVRGWDSMGQVYHSLPRERGLDRIC